MLVIGAFVGVVFRQIK